MFDITTDTVQAVIAKGCLLSQISVGGPNENTRKMKFHREQLLYLACLCVHASLSVLYDHVQADFVIAGKQRLTHEPLTSGAWFEKTVKGHPKVLVGSETAAQF